MKKRQEDQDAQAKGILPNAVVDPFIRYKTTTTGNKKVNRCQKEKQRKQCRQRHESR